MAAKKKNRDQLDAAAFLRNAGPYIELVNSFVLENMIARAVKADHISYKCESSENFERARRTFEHGGSLWMHQTMISGRRIATIRITSPIDTMVGPIKVLELSDQKPDNSQKEGFDHVELYKTHIGLIEHMVRLGLDVKEVFRPHHTTHDLRLENGFVIRFTDIRLANKIKKEMI